MVQYLRYFTAFYNDARFSCSRLLGVLGIKLTKTQLQVIYRLFCLEYINNKKAKLIKKAFCFLKVYFCDFPA